MTRIVHYINQFFAGIGGEDAAGQPPELRHGPVGPGRALAALLPEEHQIVATIVCGDDHAVENADAADRVLELARSVDGELLIAGPAFSSGRYGLACARVCALAARDALPALACMHASNPGAEEAGAAPIVGSGETARQMRPSLERLAAAAAKLAAGRQLAAADGRIGRLPRRNRLDQRTAAQRAVELMLARLAGEREQTEIPLPSFGSVTPAPPLQDLAKARIALLTEGALVPTGNPDRLESARATRWLRYSIEGRSRLEPGSFQSVHGGFSTVAANEDPHRLLPLDEARCLEREGAIGSLHGEYLTTAGNGTQVAVAQRFGREWAAELRRLGVQAAILTAT